MSLGPSGRRDVGSEWYRRRGQQFGVGSARSDQVEAIVIVAGEIDVIAKDLAADVGRKALLRNAGGGEA